MHLNQLMSRIGIGDCLRSACGPEGKLLRQNQANIWIVSERISSQEYQLQG